MGQICLPVGIDGSGLASAFRSSVAVCPSNFAILFSNDALNNGEGFTAPVGLASETPTMRHRATRARILHLMVFIAFSLRKSE
jgi:hypothetical protein